MGVASARLAYLEHTRLLRKAVVKPRWEAALQSLADHVLPSLLPDLDSVADRYELGQRTSPPQYPTLTFSHTTHY